METVTYDEVKKIKGSINIPVSQADFEDQVENAAEKLDAAGFTHIMAYEGGMKDWQ